MRSVGVAAPAKPNGKEVSEMTLLEQSVAPCWCGEPTCKIPYGYCHCECGLKTNIADGNDASHGLVKGRPLKWRLGHATHSIHTVIPVIEDARPFKIEGVYCRLIPLSQGQYAIVDESDFHWLMQWKWSALWCPHTQSFYASRMVIENGKRTSVSMHRQIMGLSRGDRRKVDHVENGDTLDNRRLNLRVATNAQNVQNGKLQKSNKSGVKGVNWYYRGDCWVARITVNNVRHHLGYFKELHVAAAVREEAARRLHGQFARLK